MALPGSGQISLDDVQTEFGGSNPISMSEYYSAATGVPASGTISLSDFHGTSADVTPDAMLFSPTTLGPGTTTSSDTITGIGTAINIQFTQTLVIGSADVKINSGTWTAITGQQISISNNDVINIRFNDTAESGTGTLNGSVTLTNKSDGDALLATLTCQAYGS